MHIWSERPWSRAREIGADVATLLWLAVWLTLGIRLYGFLAHLAGAGRFVREGGAEITSAGETIGSALEGVPLIGEGAAAGVRGALAGAGAPLITFGTDLERLLLVISGLLGLLLVAAAVVPWLNRYLPWRVAKWRRLNAAARAIRGPKRATDRLPAAEMETLLASRALHRLEYDELLEFTPDPFGDWAAGRHRRLAQAELDRVGLRALASAR
jgi:hypothetical protein